MRKSTLWQAAPLLAVLLASAPFVAESSWGTRQDAYGPDTMATEFLWTPAGIRTTDDEIDTMATQFVWVPAGSARK